MVAQFDSPLTTTDQSVERVLNAGLPVLFVFLNGSLEPGLGQAMDNLARRYAGQMLVVKGFEKDNHSSVRRFQVARFPAVIGIQKNQPVTRAEGITGAELEKHALYLVGKGPKPETAQPSRGPEFSRENTARTTSATSRVGQPRVVTDATFDEEVMRSPEPVLVDFWAPWCGPCRMVEPVVKKIAQEAAGVLRVAKVNVDENPLIAQRYNISGIPTMMIVKNGKIADRWTGALPEPALRNKVKPYLMR